MRERLFDCVKKNDERGMGENVGAVTALEYVTRKNIVERYGKKMSGNGQKYKLLVYVVFQCK